MFEKIKSIDFLSHAFRQTYKQTQEECEGNDNFAYNMLNQSCDLQATGRVTFLVDEPPCLRVHVQPYTPKSDSLISGMLRTRPWSEMVD